MQRAWPSTAGRVGIALAGLSSLGLAGSIALRNPGDVLPFFDVFVYNLALASAAFVLLLRGLHGSRNERPWVWIALGLLWLTVGTLVWTYFPDAYIMSSGVLLSDLLMLAFYPFAIIGLIRITLRRLGETLGTAWIDIALFGLGSFAATTALLSGLVDTTAPDADFATVFVLNAYLLGDLLLASIALSAAQAFRWRPPVAWWLLFAGSLTFALADASWLVVTTNGTYVEGGVLDLGWPLSALLLASAGYADRGQLPLERPSGAAQLTGPTIAVVAATAVLIVPKAGPLVPLAILTAAATVAGAIHRMLHSVRESTRFAEELRQARVDHLTGLQNRAGLLAMPAERLKNATVVLLDLDGFRDVNESLGNAAGDRVLRLMAQRLRLGIRTSDIIARTDGDEFALIVHAPAEAAMAIAETLVTAVEEPLNVGGVAIHLTACAGVAPVREITDIGSVLGEAAAALEAAKRDGSGLVRASAGTTSARSEARLRMRSDVRAAFRAGGGDFIVHYQPIVSTRDRALFAVEALVRWRHDSRVLFPGEFLDAIRQAGQMQALTEHMMTTSLRELREAGLDVPVTVNVPPDMIDEAMLDRARTAAARTQSEHGQLVLEITEDAILRDPQRAAAVLHDLREDGFRILLDDFGTGWSGLSSLRDLVVDGLKLDASFVSRLTTDETAAVIVRSVASLAAELGISVIHEGVEDPADLPSFDNGFEGYLQGYAIARPMPIADLVRWTRIRDLNV